MQMISQIIFQKNNCFLWRQFMKLLIFLDVYFNHYKVEFTFKT
jgi:hypothetical protein